jgi:hypothetical protein
MPAHPHRLRQTLCDWHVPSFLDDLRLDYDSYFRGLVSTGAQSLIFHAKNANGNCLFPSTVGVPNPGLRDDLFGEVCRRTREAGLEFIAYYNVTLSYEWAREHPEWQQRGLDGEALRFEDFPMMCLSNRELRAHVCEHMVEIARRYPVDGFFLDLQYFHPRGCFCEACQQRFKEATGRDLLASAGGKTARWLEIVECRVQTREAFIRALQQACAQVREGLTWGWNGGGNPSFANRSLDAEADNLGREGHPPSYLDADLRAREMLATGRPFSLLVPESQGDWGDWTLTTEATLRALAATAVCHGGAINLNHLPYPGGTEGYRVPQPVWEALSGVFSWVAGREAVCSGKRPVGVIGCPISERNIKLTRAMGAAGVPGFSGHELALSHTSLHALLSELHLALSFFYEEEAAERLDDFEVVVLPDLPWISEEFAAALRSYVAKGGRLLAFHHTSLYSSAGDRLPNFSLADVFGADWADTSPFSLVYLGELAPPLDAYAPAMPLLLKDLSSSGKGARRAEYCTLRAGAAAMGRITEPMIEADAISGYRFHHLHSPPSRPTDFPAIIANSYGSGRTAFLPVPFLQAYASYDHSVGRSPFLRSVLRGIMEHVLQSPTRLHVSAPSSVKVALMQDDDAWYVHLVHVQRETDSMYIAETATSGPIQVTAKPGWPVGTVEDALTGTSFVCQQVAGGVQFEVPTVLDHCVAAVRRIRGRQ